MTDTTGIPAAGAPAGDAPAERAAGAGRWAVGGSLAARLVAGCREHWGILALLGLAAVIRILVMLAYRPAFYYPDSSGYVGLSGNLQPHDARALGYAVLLMPFRRTGTFFSVVAFQHAAGLVFGAAIYALLRRRGLPRWLACVAAVPMLFDSLQITLEQYLLTETQFIGLLLAAVLALLWPAKPGVLACAAAGLLAAAAWFTRPNAMAIALLLAGYLAVRRVGWGRVAGFAVAFLIPYAAVMMWIGDRPTPYNDSLLNRMAFARAAMFADCERLRLTDAQRALCPKEPVGQRSDRADTYVWKGPATAVPKDDNQILADFAIATIRQQPGDYVRVVARELAPYFLPGQRLGPDNDCLLGRWTLPRELRDPTPYNTHCHADTAAGDFRPLPADSAHAPPANSLTEALHVYSTYVRTPPPLVSAAFLLPILALVFRRRARTWPHARDAVLLALIPGALIVLPVMTGMYEARYGLPPLPFLCLAAALAVYRLRSPAPAAGTPEPTGTPDPTGTPGAAVAPGPTVS